jgi:hypothetical protein
MNPTQYASRDGERARRERPSPARVPVGLRKFELRVLFSSRRITFEHVRNAIADSRTRFLDHQVDVSQ